MFSFNTQSDAEAFNVTHKEARNILIAWIETFNRK